MPGLYIHIPFCKQACHYCNFHFSTSLKYRTEMVQAIIEEIKLRQNYLSEKTLQTVYFGGGTPSLLTSQELDTIFEAIQSIFKIEPDAEITLEANPDDLTEETLKALGDSPVNRLSIGVQSFHENDLQFMNRAHNATEALQCLHAAKAMGFDNMTIDLIYGTPGLTDAKWLENLAIFKDLDIGHLSSYCLTVEEGTALAHFVKKGKVQPVDDEQASRQFELLLDFAETNGYLQYEISNFAKPGMLARHNTAYWQGVSYLGAGPSAHSFDGVSRQWNVANNAKYLKAMATGTPSFEREVLTTAQQFNEYILTALRTSWGVDLKRLKTLAANETDVFEKNTATYINAGQMQREQDHFILTRSGKLLADRIAMELFMEE